MFNSLAFSQSPSSKRVSFSYSGTAIYFSSTNNIGATNRRIRTEMSPLGLSFAGNNPNSAVPLGEYQAAIIFDRDNMLQSIDWTVTGDTDGIVGHLDLSSQKELRQNVTITGHDNLTGISFNSDINPLNRSNSALTLVRLFNNDLQKIDISGFKNVGQPGSSVALIQIFNNFNCISLDLPESPFYTSLSMRNLNIQQANLSSLSALTGLQAGPNPQMEDIIFPSNLISAATGTWDIQNTGVESLDWSVMGSNWGGHVFLFANPSLSSMTFPSCNNTLNSFFTRDNGIGVLDLSPVSGISGNITIRNHSHTQVLFGPSSRPVNSILMRNGNQLSHLDLSPLEDVRNSVSIFSHASLTAITLGAWNNTIHTTAIYQNPLVKDIDLSPVLGLQGTLQIFQNNSLVNLVMPEVANTFSSIVFQQNIMHGYLNLNPISGSNSNNIFLNFNNNSSWNASVSNQMLFDLDNFGWTGGTLLMSGTTSGYDTSSGGFNGFLHYTNLLSKGWDITMSGLTS